MAESGLDPIGEGAGGASLHRAPRLDPIGEGARLRRSGKSVKMPDIVSRRRTPC
jgi:hypothetical protein